MNPFWAADDAVGLRELVGEWPIIGLPLPLRRKRYWSSSAAVRGFPSGLNGGSRDTVNFLDVRFNVLGECNSKELGENQGMMDECVEFRFFFLFSLFVFLFYYVVIAVVECLKQRATWISLAKFPLACMLKWQAKVKICWIV